MVGDGEESEIRNYGSTAPYLRHNEGWNCCFVDGHVEWLSDYGHGWATPETTDPPWCKWGSK